MWWLTGYWSRRFKSSPRQTGFLKTKNKFKCEICNISPFLGLNSGSISYERMNTSQTRYNRTLLHRFFAGFKKFPDVTSVQEAMHLNYEIWPRYGAPAITDSQCKLEYVDEAGLTRSAARGVATYCDKTAFLNRLQKVLPNLEVTTTLHKYEDFTGKTCYSWVFTEILTQMFVRTTQPLQKLRLRSGNAKEARTDPQISTRDVLIVGDLTLTVRVIWEITHPALFHQHNADSGKTYIDRITAWQDNWI
jgi:hypothetical protein